MGLAPKEGSKDLARKRMKVVIQMRRMVQGKEGVSDSQELGWSGGFRSAWRWKGMWQDRGLRAKLSLLRLSHLVLLGATLV